MNINKFLFQIKDRLENNKEEKVRLQLKTVLKRCGGYSRRSQKLVDRFNDLLVKNGLEIKPSITVKEPASKKDWIYFMISPKGNVQVVNSNKKRSVTKMNTNFNPYPHQKQAWNHMDKHYIDLNKQRGMVILPTGGGKTTVATYWIIKNYINKGYRVLWLAHRVELLEQAKNTFCNFSYLSGKLHDESMKIVSGDYGPWSSVDISHEVVFSTDRSAANGLLYIPLFINQSKKGVFVVIDEAHHSVANQYQKVVKTIFDYKGPRKIHLLGLTATPMRMNPIETQLLWRLYDDNYDVFHLNAQINDNNKAPFQSKIYEVSQTELIGKKILSKPIPITINTEINFEVEFTDKDYKHIEQFGELGADVLNKVSNSSTRNLKIVQHYKENIDKYSKTIVFAVDIAHCITLHKEFQDQGIDSDYVVYGRKENADIIKSFKEKDSPQVLISVVKLTEGFDAPNIQTVFITRPTKSEPLLRQMIGRGLRGILAGGTEEAYLVTFVDTWQMFKPVNAGYIIDKEENELIIDEGKEYKSFDLIPISEELIYAAYELLKQKTTADITGVYQALPHSWYQWTIETEEEEIEESIIIFSNQYAAYESLREYYEKNAEEIPETLNEDAISTIVYKFFGDCSDPLPNYYDVIMLLAAIRKGIEINKFTFEDKNQFDPRMLAEKYKDLNMFALRSELESIFNKNELCKKIYKNVFDDFLKKLVEKF